MLSVANRIVAGLVAISSGCLLGCPAAEEQENDVVCPTAPEEGAPTYASNAERRPAVTGYPETELLAAVSGLQVDVSGRRDEAALCSYNFGDGTPIVEVEAGHNGECEKATHGYAEPGAYSVALATWDAEGRLSHATEYLWVGMDPIEPVVQTDRIDGCLDTTYWTPPAPGPFPAIVLYTPYSRDNHPVEPVGLFLSWSVAVVHVIERGQRDSCGVSDFFGPVAWQGITSIDSWLLEQDWFDPDRGFCLWGHSGPGILGAMSATLAPERLACAFVGGGTTNLWDATTKAGAWWPLATSWLLSTYGAAAMAESPEVRVPALIDVVAGLHATHHDSFFEERDGDAGLTEIDVPILFQTSWEDFGWGTGEQGAPYFNVMERLRHPGSGLIVFAGLHPSFDPTNERPFRAGALQPHRPTPYLFLSEVRAFLRHYLLGEGSSPTEGWRYLYLRLEGGSQAAFMNRRFGGWKTASEWPPAGTAPVELHLSPRSSGTLEAVHDGSLLQGGPDTALPIELGYLLPPAWQPTYAPNDAPVPYYTFPDQRFWERAGAAFTSEPLLEPVAVEGPVTLRFIAETSLHDFDWMVMLSDVWPDGSSHFLSSGFLRASLRNDQGVYEPTPQGPQSYEIRLAPFANNFRAGHRIRLSLHQANTTDAHPAEAMTRLRFDDGPATLRLFARSDELPLAEPGGACPVSFDPSTVPEENLDGHLSRWVTGGGRSDNDGDSVGFGFFLRTSPDGTEGGGVLAIDLPAVQAALLLHSARRATTSGWHYRASVGESGYDIRVRCAVESNPGALQLLQHGASHLTIEPESGRIHCHDVPYANFGATGDYDQ